MNTSKNLSHEEEIYEKMADAAERGELIPASAVAETGPQVAEETRAMFRQILGTDDLDEIVAMSRPGRPSLSEKDKGKNGASPVVHLRLPAELNSTIETLAQRKQQKKSELLRELITTGLKHAS